MLEKGLWYLIETAAEKVEDTHSLILKGGECLENKASIGAEYPKSCDYFTEKQLYH